jgi:hypothetical protein
MTNQDILFRKSKKNLEKISLTFRFVFMRPQTFELSKKYSFYQINKGQGDQHLF